MARRHHAPAVSWWGVGHDHRRCFDDALGKAAAICERRGARLTALRRRVLEEVWRGHRPVGAYRILDALREERQGAAPPTVYRALGFLLAQGLIHRIESLNAFVGCGDPEGVHRGQFLICQTCGTAAEVNDPRIVAAVEERAAASGFRIAHPTIEVIGLCPHCQGARGGGSDA